MPVYLRALIWALAIIGLAVLNALGLVADAAAQTLFVTLPVLAVLSINAPLRCFGRRAA